MTQQQQQKRQGHKAARHTVLDKVLMLLHLFIGAVFSSYLPTIYTTIRFFLIQFPGSYDNTYLYGVSFVLATLGYLGVSLMLLLRQRRSAAVFELFCALGYGLFFVRYWRFMSPWLGPQYSLDWLLWFLKWPVGSLLIGLLHLMLTRWLWRSESAEE
ncbi:hypothetical protein [Armatimonas sp.]|uniref:hypothetical protein n=1 Tax=Armatimonas sp. TaxID=1872638 RepID=UPI00286A8352|nr:hypothetical protein [Armatimonas sp.]